MELSSGELSSGTTYELVQNESDTGTLNGLVIIPDVMGLRPLFSDLAQNLSRDWNAAVCVFDVFPGHDFPEADPETDLQNHYAAVTKLEDSRIFADAKESAQLLREGLVANLPDANKVEDIQIGLTGFCMGGMYTLKTMGNTAQPEGQAIFDRGAAFYPQIKVPEQWQGTGQGEPLAIITPESAKRTLAFIGTEDHYTPPADVQALEATGIETIIFEGCDHGFVHDPHRPAHRPNEAKESLAQAKRFLFGN